MILTNAKLEYKRLASWKSKQNFKNKDEEEYYEKDEAPTEDFISYYIILYPFKAEKDVSELFNAPLRLPTTSRSAPARLSNAFPTSNDLGKPEKYNHSITSRISNPANRSETVIKSCVRVPANTSAWPLGFSTRQTSRQIAGPGTNESHVLPINPPPRCS